MFKAVIKTLFIFSLFCQLQAHGADKKTNVLVLESKGGKTQKKMVQVLESYNCKVTVFNASFKELLADKKDIEKLKKDIRDSDILILQAFQEPFALLLNKDKEFRKEIKDFFQSGGVALFLISWVYCDGFAKFCDEEKIWHPDYDLIKRYSKYRIAFPSDFFVANEKISHPLLLKPNKLSCVMGFQNFGYVFPEGKDFFALAVRKNNSKSVGVSLQEGINGNGAAIFSCLYEFIGGGKKTMRDPKDPLAKHSMLFLENLVNYAKKRKLEK